MSIDPDHFDLVAAEYVLGTLDPAEGAALLQRAQTDPALAAAVERWQVRLSPLARLAPDAPEPDGLWAALAPRLQRSLTVGDRVPLAVSTRPPPDRLSQVLRSRTRWRVAAAVLLVVGLGSGGAGGWWWLRPATPLAVAALAAPGFTTPLAEVTVAKSGMVTLRPLHPLVVAAGHSLALWALPLGAGAPVLLGSVLPGGGSFAGPSLPEGSQVMVTLEPATGAAPGEPPGMTLFAGVVTAVPAT